MFDPVTATFLRSAPAMPGLDPADLPQILTARYAELMARRLRGAAGETADGVWPLARIADAYELVTSVNQNPEIKRAAAFVAATAQQILAQEATAIAPAQTKPILDRDQVDPALAACVLFLAAEQYADANEAARRVRIEGRQQDFVVTLLAEDVRDLASGNLVGILERSARRPERFTTAAGLEARATVALFETILIGLELLAAEVMGEPVPPNAAGRFDTARAAFSRVLQFSSNNYQSGDDGIGAFLTTYPGPRHLASLLLSAYDATAQASVTKINPPEGTDNDFWKRWLRHRAATAPFVWRNHREAVEKGFHLTGTSAVMVLPTGAGKTTASCLKIGGVLGRGKNVIFIAPTHALVEQLTVDLQEAFTEDLLGSIVSSDFDRLFANGTTLRRIEVMTPEHCLALLSYAPEAFADVGLMVFDECHLLSPVSGLRRALDGMFCVLALSSVAPDADLLFLSAMIKNGAEFAAWIKSLTGRECSFVEPLWKPSRQARGVVVYEKEAIERVTQAAFSKQHQQDRAKRKRARGLRKEAKAELKIEPFALFGLQHNWLRDDAVDCAVTKISDEPVRLNGALRATRIVPKPNVNEVAAHLAVASARNGLKTIVFVNVKSHAISTAREIAAGIGRVPDPTTDEAERWKALEVELGRLEHSLLSGPTAAVPHNAQMLRLERDLAERMFRRVNGAQVIVATPTLAQGLNLPAHIAILASDMRADLDEGGRQALGAHEILNAAARAGRAGHLANGIVLLIPEEVLTFEDENVVADNACDKLRSLLPEDDRCLEMSDALQVVLDRIGTAAVHDRDVEYALNRLSTAVAPEGAAIDVKTRFAMDRSFAAFRAQRRNALDEFAEQVAHLSKILAERNNGAEDQVLLELAAQSGAPVVVLGKLRAKLTAGTGGLPTTIPDWVAWVFKWLYEDKDSRLALLDRERAAILGAVGRKVNAGFAPAAILELLPGVIAWLNGAPLCEIERSLGGNPVSDLECPRARRLVTAIVPLGLTFVMGLVARTAQEIDGIADGSASPRSVVESLPTAVRRGFDTPSKLAFAELRKGMLSRVQIHAAFTKEIGTDLEVDATEDYGSVVARMRSRIG